MTIKKYAVPAGVTSITLPDGSVLIPVGNVVSTDSRYESELVRSGCVSDDSLYLLGMPLTIFQSAICSAESTITVLPEVTTTT